MEKEDNKVTIKELSMLGNKVILNVEDLYYYMFDLDEVFNNSGKDIELDLEKSRYYFNSYKKEKDKALFNIHVVLSSENSLYTFTINGTIDLNGNISNEFLIEVLDDKTYEVYLNKEALDSTKSIIFSCIESLNAIYNDVNSINGNSYNMKYKYYIH